MAVRKELMDFASVMESVLESGNDVLGTNGWDQRSEEENVAMLDASYERLKELMALGKRVAAKTEAVHLANLCMMVWKKL